MFSETSSPSRGGQSEDIDPAVGVPDIGVQIEAAAEACRVLRDIYPAFGGVIPESVIVKICLFILVLPLIPKGYGLPVTHQSSDSPVDIRGVGGDFVADPKKVSMFGDDSCAARPDTRIINAGAGPVVVDNRAPLTKKSGKPIEQICAQGRDDADAFIRNGARRFGLPI